MKKKGAYAPVNGSPIGRPGMVLTRGTGAFKDWFKWIPRAVSAASGLMHGGLGGAVSGWNDGAKISENLGFGGYRRRTRGTGAYADGPINDTILASPVPAMHSGDENVVLRKIEYLGDVFTSATAGAFAITTLDFNPGVMLYWGSRFAALFQQWKLNGAMVYFRSRSSSYASATALGTVMMCMNYNSHALPFTTKQEMQETTGCVACAIDQNATLGVEAKESVTLSPVKFVRMGAPPAGEDIHLYDLGKLNIATIGCPTASANVGELYIAYDITFLKPISRQGRTIEGACWVCHNVTGVGDYWTTNAADPYWNTIGATLGAEVSTQHTINLPAGTSGTYILDIANYGGTGYSFGSTPGAGGTNVTWFSSPASHLGATSYFQITNSGGGLHQSIFFRITNPSIASTIYWSTTLSGWATPGFVRIELHECPEGALVNKIKPDACLNSPAIVADDEKEEPFPSLEHVVPNSADANTTAPAQVFSQPVGVVPNKMKR